MSNKTHKNLLVGGAIICLISLPACMDRSKTIQQDIATTTQEVALTGDVLVSMKGKPVVTTDSLAVEKEKFLNLYPQLRQVLPVMDTKEFERNILEQVVSQKIVDEYVVANKIDQTEAYKKDLDAAVENIVRMLNLKHFGESKTVSVSDAEVKSFYDANKDSIPGAMLSQGGVAASGISFDDAASARAFMAKAKSSGGGFKKAAQDENLNERIKDFKLVSNQSVGIDAQLRDKIVAIKNVPSIELFEVDGTFWVVNATAKEEPKYIPFDQIKVRLKQQVEQTKKLELLQQELAKLKEQYQVQINEDYFNNGAAATEDDQDMAMPTGGIAQRTDNADLSEDRVA